MRLFDERHEKQLMDAIVSKKVETEKRCREDTRYTFGSFLWTEEYKKAFFLSPWTCECLFAALHNVSDSVLAAEILNKIYGIEHSQSKWIYAASKIFYQELPGGEGINVPGIRELFHNDCGGLYADHDWDGCVCRRCGRRYEEYYRNRSRIVPPVPLTHDWDGCLCKKCGAENPESHIFMPGNCTCGKCGEPNPDAFAHDWNGCVCNRCGAEKHEWRWYEERDWVRNRGHWTMVCGR